MAKKESYVPRQKVRNHSTSEGDFEKIVDSEAQTLAE